MKTCRFCNNQQESGDRCDACGSPFSADKVDFSEGLPDLTDASDAFPDPTASSFPDPTVSQIPDPTVPVAPVVEEAPKAEPVPPVEEAPVVAAASEAPAEKNAVEPEKTPAQTGRKIMYSAAASGETVYKKSKGGLNSKRSGAAVAGLFVPESVAEKIAQKREEAASAIRDAQAQMPVTYTRPQTNTKADPSKYQGWYVHSMITLILSCIGLLCLCGMSIPSLVISLIAFLSLLNLKNGAYNEDPERIISRSKKLTMIADMLLVGAAFLIFLILLIS